MQATTVKMRIATRMADATTTGTFDSLMAFTAWLGRAGKGREEGGYTQSNA